MLEEITPYIARDTHETARSNPAGQSPEQIVPGNKREQQDHGRPQLPVRCRPRPKDIDQVFDPILRTDCAANCGQHRGEDQHVAARPPADVVHQEGAGSARRQAWQRYRCVPRRSQAWPVLRSHKTLIDAIGLG